MADIFEAPTYESIIEPEPITEKTPSGLGFRVVVGMIALAVCMALIPGAIAWWYIHAKSTSVKSAKDTTHVVAPATSPKASTTPAQQAGLPNSYHDTTRGITFLVPSGWRVKKAATEGESYQLCLFQDASSCPLVMNVYSTKL